MIRPIPAPGFHKISGKRNPSDGDGVRYWVQCANGWVDELAPWPVKGPVWKWKGDKPEGWEVIAVKRAT